jgi:monothiol glutaredoxin
MALHVAIDGRWQTQFMLKPAVGHEIRAQAAGIDVLMDLPTAQRARGMKIDWVDDSRGSGLSVQLPLAPAAVKPLTVEALKERLSRGDIAVIDVRPAADRAHAPFPAARALDPSTQREIESWPKDQPIAFLCHFGNSSRQAAEHFRALGFRDVYNVEGGINAWSMRIDPSVPRY